MGKLIANRISPLGNNHSSIAVHEDRTGNTLDTVLHGHGCIPGPAIVDLRPRHVMRLHEFLESGSLLRVIKADTQNIEAHGVVLLVGRDDVREFHAARSAPGGPEIKQYHFAFVITREINRLAFQCPGLKSWSLLTGGNGRPNVTIGPGNNDTQGDGGGGKERQGAVIQYFNSPHGHQNKPLPAGCNPALRKGDIRRVFA